MKRSIIGSIVLGSVSLILALTFGLKLLSTPGKIDRSPQSGADTKLKDSGPGDGDVHAYPDANKNLESPPEPAVVIGPTNIPVPVFLRRLSKAAGLRIVAAGDLGGSVSASLNGVSWSAALQVVVSQNNLEAERRGSFLILRHPEPGKTRYVNSTTPSLGWQGEYHGESVDFDLAQTPLSAAFEHLSRLAHWKLALDPGLSGQVTVMGSAPWDEFFEAVLRANGLDAELLGSTLHVWKPPQGISRQLGPSTLTAVEAGIVRCVVGFTIKEPGDTAAKRAEYSFDLTADGNSGGIESGPRVPIITQTQLGGPPTSTFVDAFVRINATARLSAGTPRQGWFDMNAEYSRPLEHGGGLLNSKQSVPYLDTILFNTVLGVKEKTKLAIAGYKDEITGREFAADFSWSVLVPPLRTLPLTASDNKIMAQVSYKIGTKAAQLWLMLAPSRAPVSFRAGLRVPVLTPAQLNGPATVTYIDVFNRFEVALNAESFPGLKHRIPQRATIDCEYSRILNRPYATNSDNPYLDSVSFKGTAEAPENEEVLLGQGSDEIQNRKFETSFKWWPVQN